MYLQIPLFLFLFQLPEGDIVSSEIKKLSIEDNTENVEEKTDLPVSLFSSGKSVFPLKPSNIGTTQKVFSKIHLLSLLFVSFVKLCFFSLFF